MSILGNFQDRLLDTAEQFGKIIGQDDSFVEEVKEVLFIHVYKLDLVQVLSLLEDA